MALLQGGYAIFAYVHPAAFSILRGTELLDVGYLFCTASYRQEKALGCTGGRLFDLVAYAVYRMDQFFLVDRFCQLFAQVFTWVSIVRSLTIRLSG